MRVPERSLLDSYAQVLVEAGLNGGAGMKPGAVTILHVPEAAQPFLEPLHQAVLAAGGQPLVHYIPSGLTRNLLEHGSLEQISWQPEQMIRARISEADHRIYIIAEDNPTELQHIAVEKRAARNQILTVSRSCIDAKEALGAFNETYGLYGTAAMAREAKLTKTEYWDQIAKACFLYDTNPVQRNREAQQHICTIRDWLTDLQMDSVHIEAQDTDITIGIGSNRKWLGGRGTNIPSFEVFVSPDYRRIDGRMRFNQPLYYQGGRIQDIQLTFKDGIVSQAEAKVGAPMLEALLAIPGANRLGEFSLTDSRISKIERFMGTTLFDENTGGHWEKGVFKPTGNTHIALGSSFPESYKGTEQRSQAELDALGFNFAKTHVDIVSTLDRVVTASLRNGKTVVIYKDGKFTV